MSQQPNFIIIGAMKCATSTLHEQLAIQPGIFMSKLKEPNFFSNDEQYIKGMEWYYSLFTEADLEAICGESSTHYTKLPTYPHTVERLCQDLPDVKLIYIMRHPIDRLISHYIHEWSLSNISVDINQAIRQHPELINYSKYSFQLNPYLKAFGSEKILPVFFERLCRHSQEELERICTFIGYQAKPEWNSNLGAQNTSKERMRINPLLNFLIETPVLKTFRRQFIPKTLRTRIRNLWTLQQKPEIEASIINQLESIFDADLAILGSWLGIELSCDSYKIKITETEIEQFTHLPSK